MKEVMKSIGLTALIIGGVASALVLVYFFGTLFTGGPLSEEGWVGGTYAVLAMWAGLCIVAIGALVHDARTRGREKR